MRPTWMGAIYEIKHFPSWRNKIAQEVYSFSNAKHDS